MRTGNWMRPSLKPWQFLRKKATISNKSYESRHRRVLRHIGFRKRNSSRHARKIPQSGRSEAKRCSRGDGSACEGIHENGNAARETDGGNRIFGRPFAVVHPDLPSRGGLEKFHRRRAPDIGWHLPKAVPIHGRG